MGGLLISFALLLVSFLASLNFGAADISVAEIYGSIFQFDGSTEQLVIRTVRLPRSLIALVVGSALAVAGSLMQGITGNPLASPAILGVNAGAAFAVVLATLIGGGNSLNLYAGFALLGAGLTAVLVYGFASLGRGGASPLNLTLVGASFTAFLASMTSGILIVSQQTLDQIRFWLAGSVAGRDLDLLLQVLPYLIIGLLLSLSLGKQITLLSLGQDMAQGLGQNTLIIKILAAVCVLLLAGGSVAIAGPIGFVGLIVPHMTRFLVGTEYRWILPYAAAMGGILLLWADILARLLIQPQELPVGLVMPLIGAPFFIYLIRAKVKR
ncbi:MULTISPECIES: FecCD family ABC transporter permease [unclassified Picosynechococcus]|nr:MULTISPECIES: iron ABC transporter permease [Cyanophyceae]ACB01128.1 FecCD transport (permease) family [Picosynechococcus sp. PCC 7002]SMH48259.1 iron complex transport system permease protein [Picosynechococcus sp. OG1]SMQ81273.1 iron complex transport system permease protein [Synechococcus sp. 7002]